MIESLFIEVKINTIKSVIIGISYRPNTQPLADIDLFNETLAEITSNLAKENKETYIMGDFNIDLLKCRTREKTNDLLELMIVKGYLPLITKPTRVTDHSATLIDHIIIHKCYKSKLRFGDHFNVMLLIISEFFMQAGQKRGKSCQNTYILVK